MDDINNANRAHWALCALAGFVVTSRVDTACDAIHDLIADLLHLARGRGFDVEQLATSAVRAMTVEQQEDEEGDMVSVQLAFRRLLESDD